jgi:hypothetical protein
MNYHRKILLLLIVSFGLTSCLITDQARQLNVEIMKPGVFIFPENISKVAVFKRDLFQSDTSVFKYLNIDEIEVDTMIKSSNLSNHCVDAVSNYFKAEGYFQNVRNYRDSLNSEWNSTITTTDELFTKSKSDILIFLDFFKFYDILISKSTNHLYTAACLSWTITIKNDTAAYIYNQVDTLDYNDWQLKSFNLKQDGHEKLLMDAAKYLGESFGKKIIPSWIPVERMYYGSSNPEMIKAEQFAINNEWLKAAEIWNRETKNKNLKIVAKSCYNLALASEMEGKIDLSIDWLIRSYSILPKNNKDHQANCQRYINILAMRKKEIERLDKQIRNPKQ